MSGPTSQPQWYLARDGTQHGPISDAELAAFIEQGHLQPTDLVWREGFSDWQPAMLVFPSRGPAASRPVPPQHRPPAGNAPSAARRPGSLAADERSRRGDPVDGEGRRRLPLARVAAVVLLAVALIGAGALAYLYGSHVTEFVSASTAPSSGIMAIADRKSLEAPPLAGFRGGTADTINANLQATALWRVIKREFADWYTQRVNEAAALAREGKDDAAIGLHMATKLRELRRRQVTNGLSATQPLLKTVATAYFEVLSRLRSHSVEACDGFIRRGEAEPLIVALLQGTEHTSHLQALLTAEFEAIAEGRKLPRVHPRPSQAQHEMLANDLAKRGWTQKDFVLLSKEQAQATPEKMCQLVHDLFAAQFSLQDRDAQMRLLVNSLIPVFAG